MNELIYVLGLVEIFILSYSDFIFIYNRHNQAHTTDTIVFTKEGKSSYLTGNWYWFLYLSYLKMMSLLDTPTWKKSYIMRLQSFRKAFLTKY